MQNKLNQTKNVVHTEEGLALFFHRGKRSDTFANYMQGSDKEAAQRAKILGQHVESRRARGLLNDEDSCLLLSHYGASLLNSGKAGRAVCVLEECRALWKRVRQRNTDDYARLLYNLSTPIYTDEKSSLRGESFFFVCDISRAGRGAWGQM